MTAPRRLDIIVYQLGWADDDATPGTHHETLLWLHALGFRPTPDAESFADLDSVQKFYDSWEERRHDLDYEIDGMVVKIDDISLWDELGCVGREPRRAIAYKFPPGQAATKLKKIAVNAGRAGSLDDAARLGVHRLHGHADGLRVLDVADHVHVAQIDRHQAVVGILQRRDGRVGHGGGAHLGRHAVVAGGPGQFDDDALLAGKSLQFLAVQKKANVDGLLRLDDLGLPQTSLADHLE